jgi:hypothetical protein
VHNDTAILQEIRGGGGETADKCVAIVTERRKRINADSRKHIISVM